MVVRVINSTFSTVHDDGTQLLEHKMKKILTLSTISLVALATINTATAADDNKFVSGAKTVGNGIMWAPKKICLGMKKGFEAMGNGAKKVFGKK